MATYKVVAGDTLSGIASKLGLSSYKALSGYKSGNPNLIFPGEVLTYGSKSTPKPKSKQQVQPYLTAKQKQKAKKSALPKVRPLEKIYEEATGLLTPKDAEGNEIELPEVPSLVDQFTNLREEYGVTGLENTLNDLKAAEDELVAITRQRTNVERGKAVPLGVIEGRTSEVQRQGQEELDVVQRQQARITDQLNSAYQMIGVIMDLTQQDYTNALNDYEARFERNLNAINLARDIRQEEKDDYQKAVDTARANLQVYMELQREGGINVKSLSGKKKLELAKMEVAAGFEPGFVSSIRMDPKANIISTNTLNDGRVQVLIRNPNGSFSTQIHGTAQPTGGGGSSSGGSKSGGLTPTQQRNAVASARSILGKVDAGFQTINGKLESVDDAFSNPDKQLSLQEYQEAIRQLTSKVGISINEADNMLTKAMKDLGYKKWKW